MKKKIIYTDEPLGELKRVEDFLPSPAALAGCEDNVRVTITLSKGSIAFFKKNAKKYKTPYQTMIRRVLDSYVARFGKK